MLKRISFGILLLFLFTSGVFAASFSTGKYQATVNSNIRIKPNINGNRIGYFKKHEAVTVKRVFGNWCQVEYKQYTNAYVYCPLLKPFQSSSTHIESELSEVSYTIYNSAKYGYAQKVFSSGSITEDYSFNPKLPSKFSDRRRYFIFDIYATPEEYKTLYTENSDFKFSKTEHLITSNKERYRLTLDYFTLKAKPDIIVINALYDEFPMPGNIFTFTYNKNVYPHGEDIFKTILNSVENKNDTRLKSYFSKDGDFLFQYPSSWKIVKESANNFEIHSNGATDGYMPKILITRNETKEPIPIYTYMKQVLDEQTKSIQDYKEINRASIVLTILNGMPVYSTLVQFQGKNIPSDNLLTYLQTYASNSKYTYLITASYSPKESSSEIKLIENLIKSFTPILDFSDIEAISGA